MNNKYPETSIVIRALNEERWLPDVFAALEKQTYKNFEVVLVDSGSIDKTIEISESNGARIIRIRPEEFTFGYSLNIGIKESYGSIIAIVSAHAIPANEFWLERLIKPLRENDTAMVYGGQRGHERYSKFSEKRDFERMFKPQIRLAHEEDPFTNNANSAIKKDLWIKHPFDEGLPGLEDTEWSKFWVEKGLRVLYEPNAVIIHIHTETWPQLRNRYHREAMAARWIGRLILRHIPGEIWREFKWSINDLWQAIMQERFFNVAGEILRFRYEKTIGTIAGIIDSRGLENPGLKASLFSQKEYSALVIREPNKAKIEQRKLPELKPEEVLIRVSYVGICGTDMEILEGTLGYYQSGQAKYPIVPGHEFSGEIVAFGPRVKDFSKGDPVVVECIQGCGDCEYCIKDNAILCKNRKEVGVIGKDGACAEYFVTTARYVHKVPEKINLDTAALTEPLAVVTKAFRRLQIAVDTPEKIQCAVFGAGTIGNLMAQLLNLKGHSVTVFDKINERLDHINGKISTSSKIDNLDKFDYLIEATGNQNVLSKIIEKSSPGATILLLGLPYASQKFNFESIVAFDKIIIGSVGSGAQDFEESLRIISEFNTIPFVKTKFNLKEFTNAVNAIRSKSIIKVMLKLSSIE